MLGGRITLIPKRQGSTGRPLPALSWPRTSSCDALPGRRWPLQKREGWHPRKTRYSHGPCPFLHVPRSSQLQASLPINEATVFSPDQISGLVSAPDPPSSLRPHGCLGWDPKPSHQATPPLPSPTCPSRGLLRDNSASLSWPESDNILLN